LRSPSATVSASRRSSSASSTRTVRLSNVGDLDRPHSRISAP
jgi:hypothetical protein